jgi:hypothetical protein
MNPKSLALITLRGLATLFGLQGNTSAATALNKIASAIESGKNVDDHMKLVADAMVAGTPNDWAGVVTRIEADAARLHKP